MSFTRLYLTKNSNFGEYNVEPSSAEYMVLGVPIDVTSTYRSGSRFAPQAIREASRNLESYSLRTGMDIDELKVSDAGDLNINGGVEENLNRLQLVIGEIVSSGKTPIVLGGEHTVTYGCVKALKDVAVLSFDAHLDMRDEYLGLRLSHATFMRRLIESMGSGRVMEVGVRAVCNEELEFAEKKNVEYITALDVMKNPVSKIVKRINEFLLRFDRFYLTVDMDVLDPAYAPAVGNPVPEGLSQTTLLDLLKPVTRHNLAGFDVVEVSPHYDSGVTAIQAAHTIYNILAFTKKYRISKRK